jgi:mannose/fructose/N-acetylgalactosamine-specific phosphotransferase system component IID
VPLIFHSTQSEESHVSAILKQAYSLAKNLEMMGDVAKWAKAQPVMAAIAVFIAIPGSIVSFFILVAIAGVMAPVLIPAVLVVMVSILNHSVYNPNLRQFI